MPAITAKQLRAKKLSKTDNIKPKTRTREAQADVENLSESLSTIWRVGFFDIETTGLGADFGHMLSGSIKPMHLDKVDVFRIDDYKVYKKDLCNDHQLVIDYRDALAKYDVLVHFNGENFDFPFIDTRLAIWDEERSALTHSIDLLPICRKKLRLHSNRLASVAAALGLRNRKTALDPQVWKRAAYGSKPDLDYIVEHNIADVLVTEEAFMKLRGHIDAIFRRR